MLDTLARQMLGQGVATAAPTNVGRDGRLDRRSGSRRCDARLGEQRQLLRIDSFAARPEAGLQELRNVMLQLIELTLLRRDGRREFDHQSLQRLDVGR